MIVSSSMKRNPASMVGSMGPIVFASSDPNPDDPPDEEIAQHLTNNSGHYQLPAGRIGEQRTQIGRRDHDQTAQSRQREHRQNRGGQLAVRAGGLDLALQAEPLANDMREPAEYFAQIAARLT